MVEDKKQSSLTVQALWLLVAKTLGFLFAFVLPILLTRTLSQNEYGLFKQVFLIVTSAVSLLPFGFGLSAYYYLPREKDARQRGQVVFNILLFNGIVGFAACLLLILWPGLIAQIFRDPSIPSYAASVGAVILLWMFSSFLEIAAIANQELRLATVFIVFGQLTRTALLIAAAVVFDSVRALIYAAIIHGVLQCLVLLWYVSSRFPQFWRSFDWELTRRQVAYAVPFGLAGLLYTVQTDLHNYFVSNRFSTSAFAIYSIGVAQLPLVGLLHESVSAVIIPRASYLQKHGEPKEIVALVANAVRKLAAFYLPLFAVLMVIGREFLTVMFTSAYAASWPIFAVNLLMLPISLIEVDAVVRAYEQYRYFLVKLQIIMSILMVFALWFGIVRFGLVGAISAVVLINLLLRVVLAVKFGSILGVARRDLLLFKDVWKLALAAAVAAFVALLVRSLVFGAGGRPFTVLVICSAAFGLTYVVLVVLLRVLTQDEREKLKHGIERLQQFAYLRRSASSVS